VSRASIAQKRIRMLRDLLLVEMVPDATVIGHIIVPATAYKRPNQARVIAAGPGRWHGDVWVPVEITPGDLVLVDPYRFELVLADGQMALAEGTPYAGIGDRAVISARNTHCVLGKTCPECTTIGVTVMPERAGEHYQCPKCRALFGWDAMPEPSPPWAKRMTYHHTSAAVRALEARAEETPK
jgi:chaperonin GroES